MVTNIDKLKRLEFILDYPSFKENMGFGRCKQIGWRDNKHDWG